MTKAKITQYDARGRYVRSYAGPYGQCVLVAAIWSRQLPYGHINWGA
jgi:biotin-(acetyl-CoA carboxylase) ligase